MKAPNESCLMALMDSLAEFVIRTGFKDIPVQTVEFTKCLASKIVAAMLYGATTRAGRRTVEYVRSKAGPETAGVIGAGFRCLTEDAVFINGITSHAAELEDDMMPCAVSDINIFPVVFPLAETEHLSGRELIEASALGLEVMNRIGLVSISSQGYTDLPFFGVLGSTVTAAKSLKLNAEQIKWALGISIGRASGYIVNFGTDAHYVESAAACRDGLLAAELAKRGLTGTTNLEKWLLENVWRDPSLDLSPITADLGGSTWRIHETWVKKYPCCFLTHRHIDMMLELIREEGLTDSKIAQVEIDTGPVDGTCNRPEPRDSEDARFSFQHIIACLVHDGSVESHHFSQETIADPRIAETRRKVKVNVKTDWPPEFMSGVARLQVISEDGRTLEKHRAQALGSPQEPLTLEQFKQLFLKYTRPVLTEEKSGRLWDLIMNLEKEDDLTGFHQELIYP